MAEKQVSVRIKAEGAGQLKAEFQSIGSEAQKSFGAMSTGARGGGQALQNVGFQVQDFAVQVAGGTSASRALAQQLPQLLSGFGLLGVALGTAAAVAVPLFAAFGMGTDKVKELDEAVTSLNQAMSNLRSATSAAQVDPDKLFGDFGKGAEQARQVLEIQRQIAAARAENALAQTGGALTGLFGDFRAAIALGDDAVTATNRLYALYDIADAIGVEFEENVPKIEAVAEALRAVSEADGPQQTAEAMAQLRAAIIDAADGGRALNEEAMALLSNLTDAELGALGLATVDRANPIGAAAGEAAGLAANLWDAAAAQNAFNRAHRVYGKVGARGDPRQFTGAGPQPFNPGADVVRLADEMLNPRPARRGGGGGGVSQAEREAARIYDQTRTAAEKYAIELEKLNALHKSGHLDTETYNRAVEKLGKDLDKAGDLGKKAASAIRGAFDNLFDDPAAALKNLSKQLFQMALYAQLAKSFPSVFGAGGFVPLMNANGNVFDGGRVQAFAAGGIVSSATMFPMKGGLGVMGEAGPEAILPLTRVGGKLGVAAAGAGDGGGVTINVINNSSAQLDRRESTGPSGRRQIDMMISDSMGSGRQDSVMRSRYGTPPNRVKR